MLPKRFEVRKNLVGIGHIEITTHDKITRAPIVAPQEGVDIRDTTFACSGITEVPHIHLACVRYVARGIVGITQHSGIELRQLLLHIGKDLRNSPAPQSTLTENKFLASLGLHFHTRQARTLLTTIVLFLHKQVQLIQAILPCAIFLLIKRKRFEQAHHRHTALVF